MKLTLRVFLGVALLVALTAGGGYAWLHLADLGKSLYIHSTGQSGNLLSPLYKNFAQRWSRVEYIPMSMKRSDAEEDALGRLNLLPK